MTTRKTYDLPAPTEELAYGSYSGWWTAHTVVSGGVIGKNRLGLPQPRPGRHRH